MAFEEPFGARVALVFERVGSGEASWSNTSFRDRSASTVGGVKVFTFNGAARRVASPRRLFRGVVTVEAGGFGDSLAGVVLYERVWRRRQGESLLSNV